MSQGGFASQVVLVALVIALLVFALLYLNNQGKIKILGNSLESFDESISQSIDNKEDSSKTSNILNIRDFSSISSYKQQPQVNFKCYQKDEMPNDQKYFVIKENLQKQNRTIEILCSTSAFDEILVQSRNESFKSKISFYIVYPKDERDIPSPQIEDVKFTIQEPGQIIKIKQWLSSGNIIFTLFDFPNLNVKTYSLYPQVKGVKNYEVIPYILEDCNLSFKGNRVSLGECTTVDISSNSQFFNKSELDSIK